MAKLFRMPDLPIDYIRYLHEDYDYIVFMEKYFIKRIQNASANIIPILQVADLEIDGFNNHKKVFIDDTEQYLYLVAPYLDEIQYNDMTEKIKHCKEKEILNIFHELLSNLKSAHEIGFNPLDIKFSNYKISQDGKPLFIDFDFIVYKGKPSQKNLVSPMFQTKDFGLNSDITDENVLNTSDKLLAFQMLISSLNKNINEIILATNYSGILKSYELLLSKYLIDTEVKKYLDSLIIEKCVPSSDDYFINTVIEPLNNGGLILKK